MGVAGGAVVQAVSLQCVVDLSYASRALVGIVVVPLAIALGLLLGGVLVDVASWRGVFFINLTIAISLLAVLYAGVPESRDESRAQRLDIAGAVLITLGLGGVVYCLL